MLPYLFPEKEGKYTHWKKKKKVVTSPLNKLNCRKITKAQIITNRAITNRDLGRILKMYW